MDLLTFAFEVTKRCNSDCVFCYNVWKENALYPQNEMTLSEIKALFDKVLKGLPTNSIWLSGGEPLLRKDLEDIVRYFHSRKMRVSLATNGILLDEKRTRSLIDAGVDQFEITVLSGHGCTHDRLNGHHNAFESACKAILNVKKLKSKVFVGFTATKQNILDIGEVMDLCFAFGVDGLGFYRFIPTGKGLLNQDFLMPDIEQLNTALRILDEKSEKYKLEVFMGTPIESCHIKSKLKNIKPTLCPAGISKFAIDPAGNLRLCEQHPDIIGNLMNENFYQLALSRPVRDFRKLTGGGCHSCDDPTGRHGGCPLLHREKVLNN